MAYLKPQSPLKKGEDYIYPITTVDQVISNEDGTRLNAVLDNINTKWAGCWISFTDENGNPTDEPYIHWNEES